MSHIDTGLVDDEMTQKMIAAVVARDTKVIVGDIAVALIVAGFRGFDIGLRIDAVMAGARKVSGNKTLTRAL
ncbi:MAG TPA: hypothetical protein VGC77_11100 [Rhodopseudomonas sp.]|uniref:hypothetical protein n=1 Tax=Rhodopseudomonas sp. TaxID=1078 RepID=UPI002ED96B71